MPESLTRKKTSLIAGKGGRLQIGMVAGFISERWPTSNRKPGRLQVGTPGRIKSESALSGNNGLGATAARPQVTHSEFVGKRDREHVVV
jgi:hypothetical protein